MTIRIVSVDALRTYPPRISAFTTPFWSALAAGTFQTTRCRACDRLSFPPKPVCPRCWADTVEWEELAGSGLLYSWTRIHAGPAIFADELPYAVGIVDLDAGPRLACRLHATDREDWRCGMRVELIVLMHRDGPLLAAKENLL